MPPLSSACLPSAASHARRARGKSARALSFLTRSCICMLCRVLSNRMYVCLGGSLYGRLCPVKAVYSALPSIQYRMLLGHIFVFSYLQICMHAGSDGARPPRERGAQEEVDRHDWWPCGASGAALHVGEQQRGHAQREQQRARCAAPHANEHGAMDPVRRALYMYSVRTVLRGATELGILGGITFLL